MTLVIFTDAMQSGYAIALAIWQKPWKEEQDLKIRLRFSMDGWERGRKDALNMWQAGIWKK